MKLLIVEDNRALVANLFAYFEARGHILDAAPDGATGLRLASENHYDAIVLDWTLPRMDGVQVLQELRQSVRKDVPVLMAYTFLALDALNEELEEPFGAMPNDLPLTALSTGIEITLRELLGESPLPAVTIARDFVLP